MKMFRVYTEVKGTGQRAYCESSQHTPEMFTQAEAISVLEAVKSAISERFHAGLEELTA